MAVRIEVIAVVNRFYFDHNATTPVSSEVLAKHIEALREVYGNASSIHHNGQRAKQALEEARRRVAAAIGAESREIVFLSGGTEAGNLAILGVVRASTKLRKHVITSVIEHPAVMNTCAQLEREGVEVTYLPVSPGGVVDPDSVRQTLREDTVLVTLMHANNETGTVQPVEAIGRITREAGIAFHSDGVQAFGKIPVGVNTLGVDLYTISGHKIYAPKGVGALYVRKGTKLVPLLFGGHHERDRRPGTENVPGAVALGCAAAVAVRDLEAESSRLDALRNRLERAILERVPHSGVNGGAVARVPNTTNIYFDGVQGEAMVIALDLAGFAVSTGSACSSGAVEPSHVLTALGLKKERARASLRFSLGRSNTAAQVDALAEAVVEAAGRLRSLSPAYAHHD
ncbi:MAG: cysteine desulfurase [Bryobacterales bacterium]|nr:cysteine desulfurase [Bryobacterales bacterium]